MITHTHPALPNQVTGEFYKQDVALENLGACPLNPKKGLVTWEGWMWLVKGVGTLSGSVFPSCLFHQSPDCPPNIPVLWAIFAHAPKKSCYFLAVCQ